MVEKVGETAGMVWRYLEENGDTSIPQLVKKLNSDDFMIYAALGWLAREEKIELFTKGKTKAAKLK